MGVGSCLCILHHVACMLDPLTVDAKLRGPHVARQQQLSIDICCPRPTSAANPPTVAAATDQRDKRTDGHSTVL